MTVRTTVKPIRFRDDELGRVAAAAAAAGKNVNEWVRAACVRVAELEAAVARADAAVTAPAPAAPKPARRGRREMCPHRRPAGEFCGRCDRG